MLEPGKVLKNVVKSGTIWHPSVILSLSSTIITFLTTSVTGENPPAADRYVERAVHYCSRAKHDLNDTTSSREGFINVKLGGNCQQNQNRLPCQTRFQQLVTRAGDWYRAHSLINSTVNSAVSPLTNHQHFSDSGIRDTSGSMVLAPGWKRTKQNPTRTLMGQSTRILTGNRGVVL